MQNYIYANLRDLIAAGVHAHLIELAWLYNGRTVYSTAIVTDDNGILFETIGYLIIKKPL